MGTYAVRADQDALTGLYNRRGFAAALTRQLSDRRGDRIHLILAMVDLDMFKCINDTFGHAAGDRVLVVVGDVMRKQMAPAANLCRAGGDEFLIAVVSPSLDAVQTSARLCAAVARLPHQVTASIGTVTCHLRPIVTSDIAEFVERLIGAADTAMYTAKRRGGNQAHHLLPRFANTG
jgi:diguanylate cyclase (GGDEF)-like protein